MAPTDPSAISAIRRYLEVVENGPPPSPRSLAYAIDALVMALHTSPEGYTAEVEVSTPARDYQDNYRRLRERFKRLGFYRTANTLELEDKTELVGDAIDDLADISGDLREVLWRYETLGADDAHWHFRFLFRVHWGQHARELSVYLHALIRLED